MGEMGNIHAALGQSFDCNTVEPDVPPQPVPAGWYPCLIEKADLTETKDSIQRQAKDGFFINFQFDIVDGPQKGQKLFHKANIRNKNPKAEEIGLRQLSAIGRAVGVMNVSDTSQVLNRLLAVKAKYVEDPQYGPQNECNGFKSLEGMSPAPAPAQQPQGFAQMAAAQAQQPPAPQQPPQSAGPQFQQTPAQPQQPVQQQPPVQQFTQPAPQPQQLPPAQGGQLPWMNQGQ